MEKTMWIFYLFLAIIILVIIYSLFEKIWIRIKTYYISINKPAFHGFKIVFISDLHHSEFVSKRYLQKVIKIINSLKPDIVLLGGDYISTKEKYIAKVFNLLKDLQAQFGVYGVIGNHDFEVSKEKVLEEMKKAGIISLDNESYWITYNNERIKLGGVADFMCDAPLVDKTVHDVSEDDYVILISHNPDFAEIAKEHHVDLMLSGHTHGGQITVFGLYAPLIPSLYKQKYRSGLIEHERLKVIVSHGVGVVGVPFRFCARPEITVIEFTN